MPAAASRVGAVALRQYIRDDEERAINSTPKNNLMTLPLRPTKKYTPSKDTNALVELSPKRVSMAPPAAERHDAAGSSSMFPERLRSPGATPAFGHSPSAAADASPSSVARTPSPSLMSGEAAAPYQPTPRELRLEFLGRASQPVDLIVHGEELDWVSPGRRALQSPGAVLVEHPPEWVRQRLVSQAAGSSADPSPKDVSTPRPSGGVGSGRVQVLTDDGWRDIPPDETAQILEHIAGGRSKFSISTARGTYAVDLAAADGPTQTNTGTKQRRQMRFREVEEQLVKADDVDEVMSSASRSRAEEVAAQRKYGPQSKRGKASQLQMEVIQNNAHAVERFAELAAYEEHNCGEWAVFYHSYSCAAIIYEVHAAVAKALFGFPSHQSPLPRLLVSDFAETPSAASLVERYNKEFVSNRRDHNPSYRKVAISTMCSLVALGPEASTPIIFMYGYSEKDISYSGVLENFLTSLLVPKKEIKKLSKSIIALSERHGLDVTQFGGKQCASGLPGHLLQIFIKRRLLDDLAYAAKPYGCLDKERHPISQWLNGDNSFNYGQARVVAHPKCFLSQKCVKMHIASADPVFHKNRARFQEELVALLSGIWKNKAAKERVATTIYGGVLPDWWHEGLMQ